MKCSYYIARKKYLQKATDDLLVAVIIIYIIPIVLIFTIFILLHRGKSYHKIKEMFIISLGFKSFRKQQLFISKQLLTSKTHKVRRIVKYFENSIVYKVVVESSIRFFKKFHSLLVG